MSLGRVPPSGAEAPHPHCSLSETTTIRFIPEHADLLIIGLPETGKSHIALSLTLAIEDLGMRRLPPSAAADLLEVFTRRYEQGAIILTANRASPYRP